MHPRISTSVLGMICLYILGCAFTSEKPPKPEPLDLGAGEEMVQEINFQEENITEETQEASPPVDFVVTSGDNFNCVLKETGEVLCWGLNQANTNSYTFLPQGRDTYAKPTLVHTVAKESLTLEPKAFEAGGRHMCLVIGQQAQCWGSNNNGELGRGTSWGSESDLEPVLVAQDTPLEDVSTISAGDASTCAIAEGAQVFCWGKNDVAQAGLSVSQKQWHATRIDKQIDAAPLDTISDLAVGSHNACAIDVNKSLWCWGDMRTLGVEVTNNAASAISISEAHSELARVADVCLGDRSTTAINDEGNLFRWGRLYGSDGAAISPLPVALVKGADANDLPAFAAIYCGVAQSCAATVEGELYCWGSNALKGTIPGGEAPTQLEDPTLWAADSHALIGESAFFLSMGEKHSCLKVGLELYCYGSNLYGQIGIGTVNTQRVPPQSVEF